MTKTAIAWTDRVWNPVTGCTKVSAGCKNCYAEAVANRYWAKQYEPTVVDVDGARIERPRRFTDVRTHADRLDVPLHWRKPSRVFVNSMSDLFHDDVPDEFIDRVFAVMAIASQHTFQVLTKRPERMLRWFTQRTADREPDRFPPWSRQSMVDAQILKRVGETLGNAYGRTWPLPNVWLGASAENQEALDERIGDLIAVPAAVRFLSVEPMLGPVSVLYGCRGCNHEGTIIEHWNEHGRCSTCDGKRHERLVDWVIVGGESGPGLRPMQLGWAQSLRKECRRLGIAFFFKQNSAFRPGQGEDALGEVVQQFPGGDQQHGEDATTGGQGG